MKNKLPLLSYEHLKKKKKDMYINLYNDNSLHTVV